ncbi:MAG: aminopeptidase N [Variibacter sp.]|nr:aminopeptidase N [Variibacter sp.]
MRAEEPRAIRLEDYRPPDWLVETVELNVVLHATQTRVQALLRLKPNPLAAAPAPLVLDGDGLSLVTLKLDGVPLPAEAYEASPERLAIAQPPQGPFRLEIETVVDPSANTQLMGLYRSGGAYCTQCEAEGFRRITYFPDRPDVMAVYTTRIEAEKAEAPVLLANGNCIEAGDIPGTTRHFAVWHDPFPKPCYLFALVGGDLACVEDSFTTRSGRTVTLRIYVEHGKEARCAYAMDSLKRSMRWDEEAFGREYDLDIFMIVAVSDFNMGAMENKGLNVFNDKYVLASAETATDDDFTRIEAVIAHEYFHNWTGNRITCRDWFQLCLKEGLTVFRDQEFTADMRSRAVERIGDVRALRAFQFVEDSGPLAHPARPSVYHEINNFYTTTVYEKGAEIVRMLKTLLGPEDFRRGMDLYFQRHDGEAATIEQFVACFADVCGRSLDQFLRWYLQAGTPQVAASGRWDDTSKTYRLDLAQRLAPTPGQPHKEPMVIPLALGLLDGQGRELPLVTAEGGPVARNVVVLSQPAQSFTFRDLPERPVPSINRGFSAPINLVHDLAPEDLRFLAAHDTDPFNRWQAIQTLATGLLVAAAAALRSGAAMPHDPALAPALRNALRDPQLEPAFVAQAITLPSESDIAREIGREVDPDAIFAARTRLRALIGRELGDVLRERYAAMANPGPYSPDADGAGRRALRNASLDLLAATGEAQAIARAAAQYAQADNMTDRMAALTALLPHDRPERSAALTDFFRRFESDPLVIDKWFTLQATIPEPATLARVQELTRHPAFSFTNPNRVRALVNAFAMSNPTQFNRADGAGFEFVVETVLALDRSNPQVAARLMGAFKSWRALEAGRRARAESALQRVAGTPGLSTDVSDLARRALAPPPEAQAAAE